MLVGTMQWGSSAMRGCVQAGVQHIAGAPHVVGRSVHAGGSSAGVCSRASLLPLGVPHSPGGPQPCPLCPCWFPRPCPPVGPHAGRKWRLGRDGTSGRGATALPAEPPAPTVQTRPLPRLCPAGAPGRAHGDLRADLDPLGWVPAGDGSPPQSITGGWGSCTAPCCWVLTSMAILGFSSIFLARCLFSQNTSRADEQQLHTKHLQKPLASLVPREA